MSLNIEASGDFGRREGVFSVLPKGQEDRMCADIRGLPPLCSGLLSDGGNILAHQTVKPAGNQDVSCLGPRGLERGGTVVRVADPRP